MELSHIFKLALGALWTAGHAPGYAAKSALRRACPYPSSREEWDAMMADCGVAAATAALEACGYLTKAPEHPSSLDLVQPIAAPAPRVPHIPQAGDMVRCAPFWWMRDCTEVRLQGELGLQRRGYTIANHVGGWSMTRPDPEKRRRFVSMGNGGPSSIMYLDARRLRPTDERMLVRVWDFAFNPEAHNGVDYLVDVPVWEWDASEGDFLGWEAAETPFHAV